MVVLNFVAHVCFRSAITRVFDPACVVQVYTSKVATALFKGHKTDSARQRRRRAGDHHDADDNGIDDKMVMKLLRAWGGNRADSLFRDLSFLAIHHQLYKSFAQSVPADRLLYPHAKQQARNCHIHIV